MKIALRNIGFAAASLVTLEAVFWFYKNLLNLVIGAILTNLSVGWVIVVYIFFGGLIYGFMKMIAGVFGTGYAYVCMIGTNQKFISAWTTVWVIVGVVINTVWIWSESIVPTLGFLGVVGGLIITGNIVYFGFLLCLAAKLGPEIED